LLALALASISKFVAQLFDCQSLQLTVCWLAIQVTCFLFLPIHAAASVAATAAAASLAVAAASHFYYCYADLQMRPHC